MPRQEGVLDVNGAQIHWVSVGQGTPILLIHGYPLSGELFARNRDALAGAGYHVITVDLRGFGQSSAPESDPGSLATYASDALAVMDQLNVPNPLDTLGDGDSYVEVGSSAALNGYSARWYRVFLHTNDTPRAPLQMAL